MYKSVLILTFCLLTLNLQAQWNLIHQDSLFFEVSDIHFFNEDTGLVSGQIQHAEGFILKTYDGGNTWQNTSSYVVICVSLFFINDSVGYAGGQDRAVYKTTDQGVTWNLVGGWSPSNEYDGLHFFNDSVGLLKTYDGPIFKTTDGAQNWTVVENGNYPLFSYFFERNVNPFYFITDSIGFVTANGIFRTTNQGDTWVAVNADTTRYYRAITMKNSLEGFAVGNKGALLRTTDGGFNWTYDSISDQDLRDIVFLNQNIGFAVGGGFGYYSDTTGIVLQTLDGGQSWTRIKISDHRLNSIEIIDSVGYITGNYGTIFKMDFRTFLSIETPENNNCALRTYYNRGNSEISFTIEGIQRPQNSISVFDIFGKIVFKKENIASGKIATQNLSAGTYIISTESDCGILSKKIIITK